MWLSDILQDPVSRGAAPVPLLQDTQHRRASSVSPLLSIKMRANLLHYLDRQCCQCWAVLKLGHEALQRGPFPLERHDVSELQDTLCESLGATSSCRWDILSGHFRSKSDEKRKAPLALTRNACVATQECTCYDYCNQLLDDILQLVSVAGNVLPAPNFPHSCALKWRRCACRRYRF